MIKGQIDAILWHRIKKNKFSRGLIPITRAQSIYSPKNHIGKVFEKIRFLQMCSTDQSVQPLKAGEMMMHFGLIDIRVFHFYFYISSKKPNLKHIYRITFLSRCSCRYNFCICNLLPSSQSYISCWLYYNNQNQRYIFIPDYVEIKCVHCGKRPCS